MEKEVLNKPERTSSLLSSSDPASSLESASIWWSNGEFISSLREGERERDARELGESSEPDRGSLLHRPSQTALNQLTDLY